MRYLAGNYQAKNDGAYFRFAARRLAGVLLVSFTTSDEEDRQPVALVLGGPRPGLPRAYSAGYEHASDEWPGLSGSLGAPAPAQQKATIIVFTTSLHARDLTRIQQLPLNGFLDKPLPREKVTAVLQQHFTA